MDRKLVLMVVLLGGSGSALGWLAFGTRGAPRPEAGSHTALKLTTAPTVGLAETRHEFRLLPPDRQADRETPALAIDAEGRIVAAWASRTGEDERTIYLTRSTDGGLTFSPPAAWRTVPIYRDTSSGKDRGMGRGLSVSTLVLPRLAAGGGAITLGWVEAVEGGPKVVFQTARTTDGGLTFSAPVPVHGARARRPGFTALAFAGDGTTLAAWLDGRGQGQQPFASVRRPDSEGFEPERLVFDGPDGKGICPCCDLDLVPTPDGGTIVAFRNSDSGHRDIWLAWSRHGDAGDFDPPVPVSPDAWTFDGCPHDGPALALDGPRLHVAWMDAHTGRRRLYHAVTTLPDLHFAPRALRPETAGPQGHPRLVARGGRLHAVWDEATDADAPEPTGHGGQHGPTLTGSGRAVLFADLNGDGTAASAPQAVSPQPGSIQLSPALAVGPDGSIHVAWNELDADGKRVVVARLRARRPRPAHDPPARRVARPD